MSQQNIEVTAELEGVKNLAIGEIRGTDMAASDGRPYAEHPELYLDWVIERVEAIQGRSDVPHDHASLELKAIGVQERTAERLLALLQRGVKKTDEQKSD